MLRDHVGVIDISNFAKYKVKGAGAEDWLNDVFANKMPTAVGRSCLTPLIGVRGGIAGDATVTRLADDEFMVVSSGMAERYQHRVYQKVSLPAGTTFESKTVSTCGFNVAGPKSRELLQSLSNADLSNDAWKFMRSGPITIAGIDCTALRVSFTGDLGWEIYCDEHDQVAVYAALIDAAKLLNGGPVGSRALMSLRVEKGYGSWGREYSPEYFPQEVGLDRLCKLDKDFLHKDACASAMAKPIREKMVLLQIDASATDASNADATGGEPIFKNGTGIGRVSSGTYGYSVGMSLAIGFVKNAEPGDTVDVMILGKPHLATILDRPPFDPDGVKLRS